MLKTICPLADTGSLTGKVMPLYISGAASPAVGLYLSIKKYPGDMMESTGLPGSLIIGAVAGWLAGTIMKGKGFGLLGNIFVGIVGAVLGGFLFGLLGLSAVGVIGSLVTATVGAVVLLYVVSLIKKK